jgi:hypothetical protein
MMRNRRFNLLRDFLKDCGGGVGAMILLPVGLPIPNLEKKIRAKKLVRESTVGVLAGPQLNNKIEP